MDFPSLAKLAALHIVNKQLKITRPRTTCARWDLLIKSAFEFLSSPVVDGAYSIIIVCYTTRR